MVDRLPRRLAAILYADVAGYARLTGQDEDATHRTLTEYLDRIATTTERYGGRVMHYAGDAVLAMFEAVADALSCAAQVQRELQACNQDLPNERRVRFRIGVHIGDVIEDRGDIYGEGVNVAARLESLAEPGGICISESVHSAVGSRLPFDFEFMGEQAVKNIAEPVKAYRATVIPGVALPEPGASPRTRRQKSNTLVVVVAVGVFILGAVVLGGWQLWLRGEGVAPSEPEALLRPDKPSIAVLPFTNMSGDPEQEYFADGMTDDLITGLSRISGLFVIARHTSFSYKGQLLDIAQIAHELGVKHILEGSVRRTGDAVRINAQLVDATSQGHVWAQRFEGSMSDVFGLQDKVTSEIVRVLSITLTEDEKVARGAVETKDTRAYDQFLQGWQHYLRQTPENFRQAITHFKKAIEIDPQYSRANAALAATYWESYKRYWQLGSGAIRAIEMRVLAQDYLAKTQTRPISIAYQIAADMLLHEQRYEGALREAEKAIAADPNDADGYATLANALILTGQPERGMRTVKRAMELNPRYPSFYLYVVGLAQFTMDNFGDAETALTRAIALNPLDRWSARLLLATYGYLGEEERAARLYETINERDRRGFQNFLDPITIRVAAYWHPFKNAADAERLAEGLRKSGIAE